MALSKLEGLANILVLTAVEDNAEKFMDTAGFQLRRCSRKTENVRIAYEYIESWKKEKQPFHQPTWSGFLTVLREIGLEPLAQRIDDFLKETSPSVEHLDEQKDPEDGMKFL